MASAVVTGGAGFLGSHLCEYLLEQGHRVICVDNLVSTLENIEHLRDDGFTFLEPRHDRPPLVDEPVDYLFHLAALASPIDYMRMPLHSLKTGLYGTHHALGLAKFKRARFLLASTSEVYGDPEVHPQPETYWGHVNPIGPRGVYDEAKRYAEAMTMAYHRQQGVDTSIARIFNTYGPRMRPYDGRAIPTFMRQALENKPLTVFGEGSQTRSFCYVDDLIRGIFLLAASGEHLPINLGNPREFTILELAETVIRLTGSASEIVYEALPVDDPQIRQPDITRAQQVLGWEPEIHLEEGLRRMLVLGHERSVRRHAALRPGPSFSQSAWSRRRSPSVDRTAQPSRALISSGSSTTSEMFGNPTGLPGVQGARTRGAAREPPLGRPALGRHKKRPENAREPGRPRLRLDGLRRVRQARGREPDQVVSSIVGTPRGHGPAKTFPATNDRPPQLRLRCGQALQRQLPSRPNGPAAGRPLWLAWNEPNNPVFIRPQ